MDAAGFVGGVLAEALFLVDTGEENGNAGLGELGDAEEVCGCGLVVASLGAFDHVQGVLVRVVTGCVDVLFVA